MPTDQGEPAGTLPAEITAILDKCQYEIMANTHGPVGLAYGPIRRALEAAYAAGQAHYKTAWDEINRVYDEADVLLKHEPRSYLGWNWVHALVDALRWRQVCDCAASRVLHEKTCQTLSPRPSGEDR